MRTAEEWKEKLGRYVALPDGIRVQVAVASRGEMLSVGIGIGGDAIKTSTSDKPDVVEMLRGLIMALGGDANTGQGDLDFAEMLRQRMAKLQEIDSEIAKLQDARKVLLRTTRQLEKLASLEGGDAATVRASMPARPAEKTLRQRLHEFFKTTEAPDAHWSAGELAAIIDAPTQSVAATLAQMVCEFGIVERAERGRYRRRVEG